MAASALLRVPVTSSAVPQSTSPEATIPRRASAAISSVPVFKRMVWKYYREHGRHDLPWRKTHDLYPVLVSEIMLQQTQVDRVVPLYKSFIKKFPTAKKLAAAPLSLVLKSWQGLGYNRRAKMLHQAAKELLKYSVSIL